MNLPIDPIAPSAVLSAPTFEQNVLPRVRIVLCQTSHPGNIGAAARAMKTMGLHQLVLVQPRYFPDPQAEAMASGAGDLLTNARVVDSLSEALQGTTLAVALTSRRRELAVPPMWARDAAAQVVAHLSSETGSGDVALVFGNETSGLSNEDLVMCPRWAMIPVSAEYKSLNLAAAVQILAYELRLAALDPGTPPPISDGGLAASHGEVEGLIEHLERVALESEFLDPASPKRLMPRLRRLISRASIEREEVNILRGLLAALQRRRK